MILGSIKYEGSLDWLRSCYLLRSLFCGVTEMIISVGLISLLSSLSNVIMLPYSGICQSVTTCSSNVGVCYCTGKARWSC